ncbi:MAG TPA: hypothetical protein VFK29_04375 [Rhodanobacteraceae bacterium]|nr:hypothetical protein [Rhodanobacteraceae bacterium]
MSNLTPGALFVAYVSLDPEGCPPVQVEPPEIEVKGATTIVWQLAAKSRIQDFRFFKGSLNFTDNAGLISKNEQSTRCSVYDTNAVVDKDGAYTLIVERQGKYYSTGSARQLGTRAPCIRNK